MDQRLPTQSISVSSSFTTEKVVISQEPGLTTHVLPTDLLELEEFYRMYNAFSTLADR
jgi:hypothetical protein